MSKPYLYKSKAYKRNDTATIEVDTLEFTRLILEGKHLNFEELPSGEQELSFDELAASMKQITGIEEFDKDVLRTLNLYSNRQGYNNAAALLADHNNFPGIDIARFGTDISMKRFPVLSGRRWSGSRRQPSVKHLLMGWYTVYGMLTPRYGFLCLTTG